MATDAEIIHALEHGRALLTYETGAVLDDDTAPVLVRAVASVLAPGHNPACDSPFERGRWHEFAALARSWLAQNAAELNWHLPLRDILRLHTDRLSRLVADLLTSAPLAPPVQLDSCRPLTGSVAGTVVFHSWQHAHYELWPLMVDALAYSTLIGVHDSWISNGRISRAVWYDPACDRFNEASLSTPLPLGAVLLLHGPEENERQWHHVLSERLIAAGAVLLNPYSAALPCDDKWESFSLMRKNGVPTPDTVLADRLHRGQLDRFFQTSGEPTARMVVKPRYGTSGRGVSVCHDIGSATREIGRLHESDSALVQRWAGGLHYADDSGTVYPAVIRLHAVPDRDGRYRIESGYAHVSRESEADVVSVARSDRARPLIRSSLRAGGSTLTVADCTRIEDAAIGAAHAVATSGLPRLLGIDVAVDANGGLPYVLDINPRPAGLIHSRYLTEGWEKAGEPGVSMRLWADELPA